MHASACSVHSKLRSDLNEATRPRNAEGCSRAVSSVAITQNVKLRLIRAQPLDAF